MGTRTRLRLLGSTLFVASGALTLLGERARWWPACRWGEFDATRCLQLQDHRFDQVLPSEPWEPLPSVGWLAGSGIVLLGLAVLTLGPLVSAQVDTVPARRGALLGASLLGGPALVVGVVTILAAHSGRPVGLGAGGFTLTVVWLIGPPLVLLGVVIAWSLGPGAVSSPVGAKAVVLAALFVSTPLVSLFLGPAVTGYMSHDTTPWADTLAGVAAAVAGLALWPATSSSAGRERDGEARLTRPAVDGPSPAPLSGRSRAR